MQLFDSPIIKNHNCNKFINNLVLTLTRKKLLTGTLDKNKGIAFDKVII